METICSLMRQEISPAGLVVGVAVNVAQSVIPKSIIALGGIAQLARAVALQAIGQGFESPYLHNLEGSLT